MNTSTLKIKGSIVYNDYEEKILLKCYTDYETDEFRYYLIDAKSELAAKIRLCSGMVRYPDKNTILDSLMSELSYLCSVSLPILEVIIVEVYYCGYTSI